MQGAMINAAQEGGKGGERTMVVFRLKNEEFAAPIANVSEILRPRRLWRMPRAPHYVMGLMNHRGRVLPVVDIKRRLAMGDTKEDSKTRVMVLELEGDQMGVVVDEVKEVFRTGHDTFESPPELVLSSTREYLSGVVSAGERMILMLDLVRLFTLETGATA